MTGPLVVITDSDLPSTVAEDTLQTAGFTVMRASCRTEPEVLDAAREAYALIVQWAPVTARVVASAPSLRVVSRLGIGYDMVDVDAATEHGVAVANTPAYCIEEVAAHTTAMILSVTRGLPAYDRAVRAGRWAPTDGQPMAARPSETTIGVIGFGRIGEQTARHCRALGYRVLVHDPFVSPERIEVAGCDAVSLEQALSQADVVTLHTPLTSETRHLINAEKIRLMKPGAAVVNTCRGPLIDTSALTSALSAGHLSGAALDVFETEPLTPDDDLCNTQNVLLSPHAAWYSPEALADLPLHAARNVVDFFEGRTTAAIVNPGYAAAAAAR